MLMLAGALAVQALPQPPLSTNATPPAPQAPEELPEIEETVIVSATRSNRRMQDEPVRVEVIDREEIEEKALMTPGSVAMLLGETTGLRVQTTAPSMGAANVRIQGLRGQYAQLLADGLPLYGASGDSFSLLAGPATRSRAGRDDQGRRVGAVGPAALGGVINLVSRRPLESEREALFNVTSQQGADATFWLAAEPARGWSWTLLAGYHGQPRHDLDDDRGPTCGISVAPSSGLASFTKRAPGRRCLSQAGSSAKTERRQPCRSRWRSALDHGARNAGRFVESLDTRRADLGAVVRWLAGDKVASHTRIICPPRTGP